MQYQTLNVEKHVRLHPVYEPGMYRREYNRYCKEFNLEPRVYVSLRVDQDSKFNAVDDLILRRMHNPRTLKPFVLTELEKMGIHASQLTWSRYAGCKMCPCSPGFILKEYGMIGGGTPATAFNERRFDVWITYTVSGN